MTEDKRVTASKGSTARPLGRVGRALWALSLLAGGGISIAPGCAAPESGSADIPAAAKQGSSSASACITIQRGSYGTVSDTHIANKLPPKNYGASETMSTGLVAGQERQALLDFDLSQIPAGANITSATVTLVEFMNSGAGTVNVHRITAPFSEGTETWQSFNGAYSPSVDASFSNAGTTVSFDVASLVSGWVQGAHPNHGMLLEQTGATVSTTFFTSDSQDPSRRPKLDVCFDVTCAQGTADCNASAFDGCETSITSVSNCGACGVVCPGTDGECQSRSCTAGACGTSYSPFGAACSENGGAFCDGAGACIQCVTHSDCPGTACVAGFCQVSAQCQDGIKDGQETGVDCGGPECPLACASGQGCSSNGDCLSGNCVSGVCRDRLLLGEIQTRGTNGGNDDFIEIYNPTNVPVVFDSSWTVSARSAVGTCTNNTTTQRFAGAGQTIPPHGHLLYANSSSNSYDGPTAPDGTYNSGITDAGSVTLAHNSVVVDAVCYYYDTTTRNNLLSCSSPFICEGQPVSNLPHDNASSATANVDVSIERRAGGNQGNSVDTGNSAADWLSNVPSAPQNASMPPSPCPSCVSCVTPADCPGVDTECTSRTCFAGVCGTALAPAGTASSTQIPGDCRRLVCDGAGNVSSVADNTDLPIDTNACTTDVCVAGVPAHNPTAAGTACNQGGGVVCDGAGSCVQCVTAAECPGQDTACSSRTCVANTCGVALQPAGVPAPTQTAGDCQSVVCDGNGGFTSVADNSDVPVDANACTLDLCTAGVPSHANAPAGTACSAGGGTVCNANGACVQCNVNADCGPGGTCSGNVCQLPAVLLISQIQTRGSNGGNDEFVEIYNPTNAPITFDSTWQVTTRSAVGTCASNTETARFSGSGQVIPAHGHLLYVNNSAPAYNGPVSANGTYATGIVDAASVMLKHNGAVVDAICFYFDAATQNNLLSCSTPYVCEGAPVSNLPHNNTTAGLSNSDASLERKPGGANGNGTDTNVSANDFVSLATATPRNLASAPTP